MPVSERSARWRERLAPYVKRASNPRPVTVEGRLVRMVGLTLEAAGCQAAVGDRCHVLRTGGAHVVTEVVGFSGDRLLLMPIGDVRGLAPGARVVPVGRGGQVCVGDELLGRVLDGTGQPIDGKGPLGTSERRPLAARPINPLSRRPIRIPLDVGVRSINALLTVGRGQRLGLFAGSGVGKSVLLGMMSRFTEADVTVVGLIGERGREVNEFINNSLGPKGLERSVVVAAPADAPPLVRLQGATVATAIAEHFRDQRREVLLLMDSLTRYAQAQREVGLAVGEPPATRGYPPSVFTRLPQLAERAGNGEREGGITAFYTVLRESDDPDDPIADAARAILDGHVVLSRRLAEQGLYPAVDVEVSISRAMNDFTDEEHQEQARRFRQLLATYAGSADIIDVGAYVAGSNPQLDEAIAMRPRLLQFLQQHATQAVDLDQSLAALERTVSSAPTQPERG
jgi:flagellum-specific ATP synthase